MSRIRIVANKGLLRIFLALLLVVMIMFVSNYIVYRNSISGIYSQVSQNNRLVVRDIIRLFDVSFKEINDMVTVIHALPYSIWSEERADEPDMTNAYLMQKELSKLVTSTDYIEEVIVYASSGSDLAVSSAGTISLQDLFGLKYRHSFYTAEYWKSYAATRHPFKLFPESSYSEYQTNSRTDKSLLVVAANNQTSFMNVMVLIDVERLLKRVNRAAMMQGTSLTVLDANRTTVLRTENDGFPKDLLNDVAFTNGPEAAVKRKDYEYTIIKSDYNGFLYINKVPYQFANVKSVTDGNLSLMLTTIVGAILISAMLSFYLHRPVRDILKLFGGRSGGGADYRSIQSGILHIQKENEAFKTQMTFINSEIRRGVFLHALDDSSHSREWEQRMQDYFADFFHDRQFVMASFLLRPQGDGERQLSLRIEEMTELLQKGLRARLEGAVVFHARNMQFLALIGMHQVTDRETVLKQLQSFLREAQKGELAGYDLLAAVSRPYASKMKNCQSAYQDLLDCMTYRNIGTEGSLIDVQALRYSMKVHLPLDELEKLSNCLMSGNEAEAVRIVRGLLDDNAKRSIHFNQLVPVAKTLFFALMKHWEPEEGTDPKSMMAMEMAFMRKAESAFGYTEIREELEKLAARIAERNKPVVRSKMDPNFIARYIELHYRENLDLEHMAEVLETSPKYFSNYFKKTFGVNYVEYLNKVRLAQAKEFLRNTDMTVAEVSEKTGYLNSSTFTSTFKKYTGISPSEYRKKQ